MVSTGGIARIVNWLSAGITLAIVIIVPVSYFYLAERYVAGRLEAAGTLLSQGIMDQIIARNPDWWEYERLRMEAYLLRSFPGDSIEKRQIATREGKVIAQVGQRVEPPVLSYTTDLLDSGLVVGRFRISRSVRSLLTESLVVAVMAAGSGLALFLLLRISPIRALYRAEEEINYLAATDSLTGLSNRRSITRELHKELERAKRYGSTFSVVMFDIDRFKLINDSLGHAMGDRVLQALAELLKQHIRAVDKPARWGGEEFLILAPETGNDGTLEMAEKLRELIARHEFLPAGPVTVSVGVAQLVPGDDLDTLLKRADAALYEAKNGGRNQVVSGAG